MAVIRVDILCQCEGCDRRFGIEVETAEPLDGVLKDFDSLARDVILRGGARAYTWGVRGKTVVERFALSYEPTIQAGLMLCDECSKKCDDLPGEEDLTLTQVHAALGLIELDTEELTEAGEDERNQE